MEKSNTKFVLSILLGIVVLVILFFVIKNNQNKKADDILNTNNTQINTNTNLDENGNVLGEESIALCFANYGKVNALGYSDKYSLNMLLTGSKAVGSLKLIPAEKDSKVGTFIGTVSLVDKVMMARTMDIIWTATGEGVTNKEELRIIFGEGTASIGMGEMVKSSNGIYVYKDKTKLNYDLKLTDIVCEQLDNK